MIETDIGKVINNWKVVSVKDVADINIRNINRNYPYRKIKYIDISSVENRNINEYQDLDINEAPSRAKRIIKENDILISTVRPNLKHFTFAKKVPENSIASTGFAIITAKNIVPYYLYYCLTNDHYTSYLTQIADTHTSTYPAFNTDIIEKSKIPYPPLKEQKAIAGVLSAFDDKIELLSKQNETLENIAQAIFKHWFIDKTKNKMSIKKLVEIADFLNGLACQKYPPENEFEKLPVLKIRELRNGLSDNTDYASTKVNKKYIVNCGDVIFSWSGSLMIKIWNGERCVLNQHLFKVTSKLYPKWFYYLWIKYYLDKFIGIASGKATTMGHIKRSDLNEVEVLCPIEKNLKYFNNIFDPIYNKKINNFKQIRTLTNLRDTLLSKLMSGEIRVKY
ncbi:MAG: hypothetical protein APR63_11975 [Desulfuromonas sp. SDB]|nr:MAG: hypothetical protein APR63_11975 [Desulfuromonas sp. SDB]